MTDVEKALRKMLEVLTEIRDVLCELRDQGIDIEADDRTDAEIEEANRRNA